MRTCIGAGQFGRFASRTVTTVMPFLCRTTTGNAMSRVITAGNSAPAGPGPDAPAPADGPNPARSRGHRRAAGSSPGRAGKSRPAARTGPRRKWPIGRTMTLLLAIPVIAMIALWAYAATTTIGPYLAQRNGQTVDREIGMSSEQFLAQLTQERADTLAWQTAHGAVPKTTLTSQRAATDSAATALKSGLARTGGIRGGRRPARGAVAGAGHGPADQHPDEGGREPGQPAGCVRGLQQHRRRVLPVREDPAGQRHLDRPLPAGRRGHRLGPGPGDARPGS